MDIYHPFAIVRPSFSLFEEKRYEVENSYKKNIFGPRISITDNGLTVTINKADDGKVLFSGKGRFTIEVYGQSECIDLKDLKYIPNDGFSINFVQKEYIYNIPFAGHFFNFIEHNVGFLADFLNRLSFISNYTTFNYIICTYEVDKAATEVEQINEIGNSVDNSTVVI